MLKKWAQHISFAFAAGTFGTLLMALLMWTLGEKGIPQSVGVGLAPSLTLAWLYPQMLWGGLLGCFFLIPFFGDTMAKQVVLITLIPTALQLFWFLPQAGQGYLGVNLGTLTPFFVLGYSLVWSIATALWLKACR